MSLSELALAAIWIWLAVSEIPSSYTLIGGAIISTAVNASGAVRRPLPMA